MIRAMVSAGRTLAGLLRPAVRRASDVPVKGIIDYSRTPDPAWQAQLDALCPPTEHGPALMCIWHPGEKHPFPHADADLTVHRWVIVQLQEWRHVEESIQQALEGPHPRTDAYWQLIAERSDDGRQTLQIPRLFGPHVDVPVDRVQYELYHALKAQGRRVFPRYFWVVQGPNGGHPYQLTTQEAALWRLQGRYHPGPAEALPGGVIHPEAVYADVDQRVFDAITAYDLWRFALAGVEPDTAPMKAKIARMDAQQVEANRLRWAAYANKSEEIAPVLAHAMRADGWHNMRLQPVGHTARRVDLDEARDRFIHDQPARVGL